MKNKLLAISLVIPICGLLIWMSSDYTCACAEDTSGRFGIIFTEDTEKDREKVLNEIPKGSSLNEVPQKINSDSSYDYYTNNCREYLSSKIVTCSFDTGQNRLELYKGYEITFILNDKMLFEDINVDYDRFRLMSADKFD